MRAKHKTNLARIVARRFYSSEVSWSPLDKTRSGVTLERPIVGPGVPGKEQYKYRNIDIGKVQYSNYDPTECNNRANNPEVTPYRSSGRNLPTEQSK